MRTLDCRMNITSWDVGGRLVFTFESHRASLLVLDHARRVRCVSCGFRKF